MRWHFRRSARLVSLAQMKRVTILLLFFAFAYMFFMWKTDISYSISNRTQSLVNFNMNSSIDLLETYKASSNDNDSHSELDHSCLPFSGALWSQKPDSVNWTDSMEMCESILRSNLMDVFDEAFSRPKSWTIPQAHTDESIVELLSDCNRFLSMVPFPFRPSSKEEATFPLAYVLMGARNAAQTVRFFRNIYQPQNAYCITYDNKSGETYKEALHKLVGCFPGKNVYLTPSPEIIHYAHYSILRSVMVCLKVLIEQWARIKWRYVQITSWNDFPLKTNREMVRIFQILNGTQDSLLDPLMPHYFTFDHGDHHDHGYHHATYQRAKTQVPRKTVPYGLTMYKGSLATSMTNEFVHYLFTNKISQDLYKWMDGAWCPEEQYWATLIHNAHLDSPGSFPGQCFYFYQESQTRKPWVSRYQIWSFEFPELCNGKIVSLSCVYGVGDIPLLIERPELIAHKVYEEFEPATTFCLDYWYRERTCHSPFAINESYYRNFPTVRYQAMANKNDFIC